MSKTLNLFDHSLLRGRRLGEAGRASDAARVFQHIGTSKIVPANIAGEALTRLGELQLQRGQIETARQTLSLAVKRDPSSAEARYYLGMALLAGDDADLSKALESLTFAVALNPEQARFYAELGKVQIALGLEEAGFQSLSEAVDLEPANPGILHELVDALIDAGADDKAAQLIKNALFRYPRLAGFRKLWSDFRFCQALGEDALSIRAEIKRTPPQPRILPFPTVQVGDEGIETGRRLIRRDPPAAVTGPHLPLSATTNDLRMA
jgi:tetratricopeptide (TPR) repeat protein